MKKRPELTADVPVVELAHPSYQPTRAELNEPIEFPDGTTPDDLVRAVMRPVDVRYTDPKPRR